MTLAPVKRRGLNSLRTARRTARALPRPALRTHPLPRQGLPHPRPRPPPTALVSVLSQPTVSRTCLGFRRQCPGRSGPGARTSGRREKSYGCSARSRRFRALGRSARPLASRELRRGMGTVLCRRCRGRTALHHVIPDQERTARDVADDEDGNPAADDGARSGGDSRERVRHWRNLQRRVRPAPIARPAPRTSAELSRLYGAACCLRSHSRWPHGQR